MLTDNFDGKKILEFQINQHSNQRKKKMTKMRKDLRERDIFFINKFFTNVKNILCIGSRDDSEVQQFIDKGFNAVGIDISTQTELIRKCDAHKLNKFFKNKEFDIVYASHVLEHMTDPNKVMTNIRSIARYGVIILLPLSPKGPCEKHPSIFEIMRTPENNDILKNQSKYKNIWRDFNSLKPCKIVYSEYRKGINEREVMICLKFK